jgi:hypothetical protein
MESCGWKSSSCHGDLLGAAIGLIGVVIMYGPRSGGD